MQQLDPRPPSAWAACVCTDRFTVWRDIIHLSICNLNIPLPQGAFDTLPFPGNREFDFRTTAGVGNLTSVQNKDEAWFEGGHDIQSESKRAANAWVACVLTDYRGQS